MDRPTLWRALDHLVREGVVVPGGSGDEPDLVADPDGVSTAGILGALMLAAVGPRRLDLRGTLPDLAPDVAASYVLVHHARDLAMLDCMYRPRSVPEDRAIWLRPGDAAHIAAWLSDTSRLIRWVSPWGDADPVARRRTACGWSMRRIIAAMLAADGDLERAVRGTPTRPIRGSNGMP